MTARRSAGTSYRKIATATGCRTPVFDASATQATTYQPPMTSKKTGPDSDATAATKKPTRRQH